MFEWIADPQAWMALATLTLLEIVLGIDNIIFLTILVNRMPPAMRNRTRLFGIALGHASPASCCCCQPVLAGRA
jgi:predicted tellurium resistance membrane protein TerC